MLRKIYLVITILLVSLTLATAQSGGAIKGKVIDKATREGVPLQSSQSL